VDCAPESTGIIISAARFNVNTFYVGYSHKQRGIGEMVKITTSGGAKLYKTNGKWRMTLQTAEQYALEQTVSLYGSIWQVIAVVHSRIGNVSTYTLIDKGKDEDE
jgi:hypothetical protein